MSAAHHDAASRRPPRPRRWKCATCAPLLHPRGHAARRGRRVLHAGTRQDPGPGRRVRLGQVRHRLFHHGAGRRAGPRGRRTGPVPGPRPDAAGAARAAQAAGQPHRHDLPGSDDDAEPRAAGGRADDRDRARPQQGQPRPGARTGPRHARHDGHPQPRGTAAGLPASIVRRHAPARGHRHRHAAPAGPDHRRRTHHGAGRHHPGADPVRGAEARAAARHQPDLDHPRPVRGGRPGRRSGRDVRRPHRRARHGRRRAGPSAASLYRGPDRQPAQQQPARPAAAPDSRHDAQPAQPAPGLRLRHALRARQRRLYPHAPHQRGPARPPRAAFTPPSRSGRWRHERHRTPHGRSAARRHGRRRATRGTPRQRRATPRP